MSELLRIDNLSVTYPHSQQAAVDGISLTLKPGEKLGLVGESGCGKSTAGRAAMRLLPPGSGVKGQILFEGRSIFDLDSGGLRRFRGEAVALVFQDPMTRLDPLMTIGDHCLETLQAHRPKMSRKRAKEKAIATLETVNIPADRWSQYPHEFSGGMRQRVAIALALLLDPKLIVADEPTTSLDVTISAQILQELSRLCQERNLALMLISHDLAVVAEYCDRVAVMYAGKIVEMGRTKDVLQRPQHDYTRSLLEAAWQLQAGGKDKKKTKTASVGFQGFSPRDPYGTAEDLPEPLLQLTDVRQYYTLESNILERLFSKKDSTIKAVDRVTLDLYCGEILGLVGESGCGKSTLSRTILQLIRPTGGTIVFRDLELSGLPERSLRPYRRRMQMIFQDPHACLNPKMTVGQNIADPLFIHNLVEPPEAKTEVERMLERVGLIPTVEFYDRYPSDLSGGQQQRVAIARALITRPELVICDEPVSMLDANVQAQVLELMLELKAEFNLTYLFITHDLWVARFLCDRIAVMKAGQIVEMGDTEKLFDRPQHPYTKMLLQAAPSLERS